MINKTQYVSSDEFLEKEMKKKYYYVLSTNTYRQCSKTNLQVRVLIQITVGKCQIQVQSLDSTAQVSFRKYQSHTFKNAALVSTVISLSELSFN